MAKPPSESTSPLPVEASAAPKIDNRLSIAHLLLWTTATAIVLALLQMIRPEATFAQGPKLDPQFDEFMARMRESYRWMYATTLVFSPVYGAAVAGAALALWRLVTRRFGFPSQPGHWLLLMIAVSPVVVIIARLQILPPIQLFVGHVLWTGVALGALVQRIGPRRWRLTFQLAALGFAGTCLPIGLSLLSLPPGWSDLAGFVAVIPGLLVAGAVLAALGSSILDFTARERFDIFHWVGVAALFGLVAHVLAVWGVSAAFRA